MRKISIILGINNPYEVTNNFFEHIYSLEEIYDCEVICVLDGDQNAKNVKYLKELSKTKKNLKLISLAKNVGYAAVNNIGAKKSKGEFFLFINSDIFPEKTAITRLYKYLISNPSVGVVQGLLIYPQSELVQSAGHVFGEYINRHALEGRHANEKIVQLVQERQGLSSAFYMTRKSIFKQIGGFDEFYYNAWDGMDMSLKIYFAGYKCVYYPFSKAYHLRGGARKFFSIDETQQAAYFWHKWGLKLSNDLYPLLSKQLPHNFSHFEYMIINCSVITSLKTLIEYLKIKYSDIIFIRDRFGGKVDLYSNLSYAVKAFGGRLLFISNNFQEIAINKKWISSRGNYDLIIDLSGNVVFLKDLL